MKDLQQLREYYNEEVKDFFAPAFEQLTTNQIKTLNNSFGFVKWKISKGKKPVLNVIKKSLHFK